MACVTRWIREMNERPSFLRVSSDTLLSLFSGALLLLTVREVSRWITAGIDEIAVVTALHMLPPLDAIALGRLAVAVAVAAVAAPISVLPLVKLASRRGLDLAFPGGAFAAAMQVLIARSVHTTNLLPNWFEFTMAAVLFAAMTAATMIWWRR